MNTSISYNEIRGREQYRDPVEKILFMKGRCGMSSISQDLFAAARNAQKAGILDLLPAVSAKIAPGERFFESWQRLLLEETDLEKLDEVLYNCEPVIRYMADEVQWKPADFTSDDMFKAIRNLQRIGIFDVLKAKTSLPGSGDRYFEHYQSILLEKVGAETLDYALHTLGQCIKFLSSEAAMVNVNAGKERRTCA